MKYTTTYAALVAASAGTVLGKAQLINGNWYDSAVERIIFINWGQAGTYNRVTDMSSGQCIKEAVSYSGGMSPLDGEVSWHFRGPMHLKQFAFYTPGSSSTKRGVKSSVSERRHDHGHHERALGDIVTATINGQVVTWANDYAGAAAPTPGSPSNSALSNSAVVPAVSQPSLPEAQAPAQKSGTNNSVPVVNAGAGNWGRQAYYNSRTGTADGLVFLNNMGGQGSGVFDYHMGNSLSYMAADTRTGSASPQVLADTLIAGDKEVIIYSDKLCQEDSCGATRPGTVAYHGFDGESKLFLVEFDMPMSGETGWNKDMPAAWILNANIARTQQYGDCSCWGSGCGEWDVLEVLDSGNHRAVAAIHAGTMSGTDTNYFDRPVDKTMKAAIIFDSANSAGHVVVLSDDTTFDAVIADQVVTSFGKKRFTPGAPQAGNARIAGNAGAAGAVDKLTSVFKLGSASK